MKITSQLTLIVLLVLSITSLSFANIVLVEAEAFDSTGGWFIDQQFMDQMGSPYLLAHGLGEPVDDAVTMVNFPATGTYRIWVRTKNWVPGPWHPPGRFQILIDNKPVSTTFGTNNGWGWQDGGKVEIKKGKVKLTLHDLTGFNGRCDAIYFDTDLTASPPNELSAQRPWRNRLRGLARNAARWRKV